ncbi:papilin [Patella vulgata]|uniref:papilin n=1 Tax=Patella vulgata TaxID=6465 RepID=UPI0024A8B544|nr:papilin [Patella vulgata]
MALSMVMQHFNGLLMVLLFIINYTETSSRDGWGPWTVWSVCSATCGQGLVYSQRRCHRLASQNSCRGHSKRFKLCNLKECENIPEDPTIALCRKQNHIRYGGKRFYWEPFINPVTACELSCKARGHHYVYNLKKLANDGFNCGVKDRAVCLAGRCMKVGCDDILGSNTTLDRCGLCGGNGNTCKLVTGIFTKPYLAKYGYNTVISIPTNARSISVSEIARSRNFLALKSNGRYRINGHRRLHRTGDYQVAGTTFVYNRHQDKNCPGECLTAVGPIKQSVDIEILYYHRNPGIKYQYTIVDKPPPGGAVPLVKDDDEGVPLTKLDNGQVIKHGFPLINSIPEEGIPLSKPYNPSANGAPIPKNGIPLSKPYNPNGEPLIRTSADNRLIIRNRASNGEVIKNSYDGHGTYPRYIPNRLDSKLPLTGHVEPSGVSDDLSEGDFEKKHYIHTNTYDKQSQAVRSSYGIRLINNTVDKVPSIGGFKRLDNTIDTIGSHGVYTWSIVGFTDCSVSCGGGLQETKVICINHLCILQVYRRLELFVLNICVYYRSTGDY